VIISLLVAVDEAGGIGKMGKLPWHLSADLKRFKSLTWGHHMIMGRKTYESIGRALPGRTSIIITHKTDYQAPGCQVASSLAAALKMAEERGEQEAFVIGGGEIFILALPVAQRLHLTRVHATLDCDVFFPALDEGEWVELERSEHPADEKNEFPFTYILMERKQPDPALYRGQA